MRKKLTLIERKYVYSKTNGHCAYCGCEIPFNGAVMEAELETSKMTEIHKISTLTAIAMCCSTTEVDEVAVAIGIPVKLYENVANRNEYKNYILPDGLVTMKIKNNKPKALVNEVKFKIVAKYVYPETGGAIYLNMKKYENRNVAVIDIGNLNINGTCWQNFELDRQYSLTDELGGSILISGLSQELTAAFSRCDENLVARVLRKPLEERKLVANRPNPELEDQSKEMIHNYLVNHVKEIKRRCDAKRWSLDYMELVFIGGTTSLLEHEIREVFGEEVSIPDEPEYANVMGFLRRLCATELEKIICLNNKEYSEKEEKKSKKEEKSA